MNQCTENLLLGGAVFFGVWLCLVGSFLSYFLTFFFFGLILDSSLQIHSEKEIPFSFLMALVGLCYVTVTPFNEINFDPKPSQILK